MLASSVSKIIFSQSHGGVFKGSCDSDAKGKPHAAGASPATVNILEVRSQSSRSTFGRSTIDSR